MMRYGLSLVLLLLAGCAESNASKIVGTWEDKPPTRKLVFDANKNYSCRVGKDNEPMLAHWSFDGDNLTLDMLLIKSTGRIDFDGRDKFTLSVAGESATFYRVSSAK